MQKKNIIGLIVGGVVLIGVMIAFLGMYKFNYLSSQPGYDVDGNKIGQNEKEMKKGKMVGEDKDEHGCIGSAGYVWSEDKKECVRPWEENKKVSHLISPEEFKKKLDSGEYVLVDIRTPEEFKEGHIPGATLNLDFYAPDFKDKVSKLDKNKKYLYYCRSGHRSGEASELAKEFGFTEAYELDGGINAWKEAGHKTN